jgi:hypothetical protein
MGSTMTFIDTLVSAAMGAEDGEHAAVAVALAIDETDANVETVSRTITELGDAFCRPYLATEKGRHDALRDAIVGCLFWLTNLKSPTTADRFHRVMALLWVPEIYGDDRMREIMLDRIIADARTIIYEAKE